jgi:hypothetical protein
MTHDTIGEAYVRLALALDQHSQGYVDAYFGPPHWQEQANADGPPPLPALAQQAASLADLIANATTLDAARQSFLARQVAAMQTSIRLLQGERMALADEVEALYDVRPHWIAEAYFVEQQRGLDALLPPGGTLQERMARRKQALELTVAQAQQLLPLIQQHLRQRSHACFPLPADEALDIVFVQDQPWMAYNCYLGGGRSRIEINIDLPLYIHELATYIAHEAYPGHHTELCIKESRLVREAGHMEHTITLLNAPSCVVAEGIATCALSMILPEAEWVDWHATALFPRAGYQHLDAQREYAIEQAVEGLNGVYGNAAFLLHEEGATAAIVSDYLQQYGLLSAPEAAKRIEFLSSPADRAYIFTYSWGQQLLEDLFAQKQDRRHWFQRLLTEAVTPSQIRQWMAA